MSIQETVSRLNTSLMEESAWHEDLAGKIYSEIASKPQAWLAMRKHWPALTNLVDEFVLEWNPDPAEKVS